MSSFQTIDISNSPHSLPYLLIRVNAREVFGRPDSGQSNNAKHVLVGIRTAELSAPAGIARPEIISRRSVAFSFRHSLLEQTMRLCTFRLSSTGDPVYAFLRTDRPSIISLTEWNTAASRT